MTTYFSFNNLYQAYVDCRLHKSTTINHLLYRQHLERNLRELEQSLANHTYHPVRSIAFVVTHPKIREVFAADFSDRVVHHLLYNYLEPIFEPKFIYDSFACRKHKGTHASIVRLQQFAYNTVQQNPDGYYLKMDIKSFFMSIDKHILFRLIAKQVKNPEILWLTQTVIFHDCARDIPPKIQSHPSLLGKIPPEKSLFTIPTGKGLPIGNLTSQFFANVYLDRLDQFVKHQLKVKYYVRYVDDFILLAPHRDILLGYQKKIEHFLGNELALTAHPNKTIIRPINSGIDFVGYIVRPDYTLVRKRVVGQWRYKLQTNPKEEHQKISDSYCAHTKFANARRLEEKMNPK